MIYVSKITCESIPTSVQMIYVSKITCESIPASVHMIYVSKITCETSDTNQCNITSIPTSVEYTSQCSDDL